MPATGVGPVRAHQTGKYGHLMGVLAGLTVHIADFPTLMTLFASRLTGFGIVIYDPSGNLPRR
jgi:hypothetical protein